MVAADPIAAETSAGPRSVTVDWRLGLIFCLAVAFVAGQLWLQKEHLLTGPPNEFLMAYSSAKVIGATDIYDPSGLAFQHSPLSALLISPLTALPYPNAFWTWSLLGVWSVVGFVMLWRPPDATVSAIAALASGPLFVAFLDGRALPLMLLFVAAGVAAAKGGREFHAGLWLSLAFVQPQLFLLLPLAVVAKRRWAVLRGMAVGGLALLGLSVWASGSDWPWRMAAAWAGYPLEPGTSPTIAGLLTQLGLGPTFGIPAAAAVAVLVWIVASRSEMPAAVGTALAAGLLVSPRAELADAAILLPGALALYATARTRALRWTALLLLTPLPYFAAGSFSMPLTAAATAALLALAALESVSARWPIARPLSPEAGQRA